MAKRDPIEKNLLENVKRRRKRASWIGVAILLVCSILLITIVEHLSSCKTQHITNNLSGDFMYIITPDSTNYRYEYDGYTAYFNPYWRVPSAIVYELTSEEQSMKVSDKRASFKHDSNVANCPYDSDYKNTGYDRGHMAPAGDMNWDKQVYKQSFLLTNIAPQNGNLNSGQWKGLENAIRKWSERDSALIIITGTIFADSVKTIGKNKVGVPTQLYKIVFAPYVENPRMIAYLYDNIKPTNPVSDYVVTVDEIERLSGNDFFSTLPNKIEHALESNSNLELWNIYE